MPIESGSYKPMPWIEDAWIESAACRGTDPNLFFPAGTTGPAIEQIENAKAVCASCEVCDECLYYALATKQEYGVWGGMDEEERNIYRKQWVEERGA